MYNCSHRVENITATATNVVLTVSDSTNISSYDKFDFHIPAFKSIRSVLTGEPLPVLINVNGANISVLDKNSEPLLSDKVPRRSQGRYIVPATGAPFVILYNTPLECNCKCCKYKVA